MRYYVYPISGSSAILNTVIWNCFDIKFRKFRNHWLPIQANFVLSDCNENLNAITQNTHINHDVINHQPWQYFLSCMTHCYHIINPEPRQLSLLLAQQHLGVCLNGRPDIVQWVWFTTKEGAMCHFTEAPNPYEGCVALEWYFLHIWDWIPSKNVYLLE